MLSPILNRFSNEYFENANTDQRTIIIQLLLFSMAYLVLSAFIIKLLWNTLLPKVLPSVKPISVWQAVLLKLLFNLLHNWEIYLRCSWHRIVSVVKSNHLVVSWNTFHKTLLDKVSLQRKKQLALLSLLSSFSFGTGSCTILAEDRDFPKSSRCLLAAESVVYAPRIFGNISCSADTYHGHWPLFISQ